MKPIFAEELRYLGIDSKYENKLLKNNGCFYYIRKAKLRGKNMYQPTKLTRKQSSLETINLSKAVDFTVYYKHHYKHFTSTLIPACQSLLQSYALQYDKIYACVSGGKDSTVLEHICSTSNIPYTHLFSNTTNETHFTYQYIKQNYPSYEIINPEQNFHKWCVDNFIPSKVARACCSVFKEDIIYKSLNTSVRTLFVNGVRRSESPARSKYTETAVHDSWFTDARDNWLMLRPILNFIDTDIWAYIFHHNLPFNKLYEFGYNRVGCAICPYRTNYELKLNAHFLPTYTARWNEILRNKFIENGTSVILNCTLQEYLDGAWRGGQVRSEPTEEIIQEFASLRGTSLSKAREYFVHTECECGKKLNKDAIALNMKLLGRKTTKRFCLKCLARMLGTKHNQLTKDIRRFKSEGCGLF